MHLLGTVLFHALFGLDFRLIILHVAEIAAVFLVFRFVSHVRFVFAVLAMLRHTKHQSFRMLLEFLPGDFFSVSTDSFGIYLEFYTFFTKITRGIFHETISVKAYACTQKCRLGR